MLKCISTLNFDRALKLADRGETRHGTSRSQATDIEGGGQFSAIFTHGLGREKDRQHGYHGLRSASSLLSYSVRPLITFCPSLVWASQIA